MNYERVDKKLREAKFFLGKMQVEQQRMGIEHKRKALVPISATVANAQGAFT